MSRLTPVAVAVLSSAGILGACTSTSSHPPIQDVSVTGCNADAGGGRPTASGTVMNHTSKASSYAFSVTFYDSSGNRVTAGGATVGKVEAGASSKWSSTGATDAKGPLTCKISAVTRAVAP